jgi:tRNA pseudouridine55 synthase
MFGILIVDKPIGITSHDVVNQMRRRFSTRRVGHAGTLDPLATGVLVVAVGSATRFLQYLALEPKEYVAEIEFGRSTDTYDREGEVTFSGPVPELNVIEALLSTQLGLIDQLPPAFSAVKYRGKPLYRYAREGEVPPREPRTIHIGVLEPLGWQEHRLTVRVECSGGTYIRTLADDLGRAAGCGAHLSGLRRTRVGRFREADACTLEEASPSNLLLLREALSPMPMVPAKPEQVADARHGRPVRNPGGLEVAFVALLDGRGDVFSVARVDGPWLRPECVIPAEVAGPSGVDHVVSPGT